MIYVIFDIFNHNINGSGLAKTMDILFGKWGSNFDANERINRG